MEALWRTARTLSRRAAPAKGASALPPLFFVTDPARTPEPEQVAERLPAGCGIIFRGFGRAEARSTAERLARISHRKGLTLLIGADEHLAARVGASGVHLPERRLHEAPGLRRRRPGWLITGAAHSESALIAGDRLGLDAALLSAVFESRSPSAGRPLGVVRFSALARRASLPVYALGGVNACTARRLLGSGAAGLAAVEGLA